MSQVWLRASLVIIMLGVTTASGYQVFLTEQQIDDELETDRAFMADAWRLTVSLTDLRAAQQAYVAAGQDRGYWVEKVAERLDTITTDLGSLTSRSMARGATNALERAASSIEDLQQMDELARDHSFAGQALMASDLIFTDGLELVQNAVGHVDLAQVRERAARDAATQETRNGQRITLSIAMGTSILVTLLLVPVARLKATPGVAGGTATVTAEPEALPVLPAGRVLLDLDTDRLSLAENPTPLVDDLDATAAEPVPDLRLAADLCTELGRLSTIEQLPALLARAAGVLNATGIIVWVRDSTGEALGPAIGHGYAPLGLTRLGPIACDGSNATAAAYREKRIQVVPGNKGETGAIVVPLIGATSCLGVLSVELKEGWEANDAVQATTAIFAAQLTPLVTDPMAQTAHPQHSGQSSNPSSLQFVREHGPGGTDESSSTNIARSAAASRSSLA